MELLGVTNFQRTKKFKFTAGTRGFEITICSVPFGHDDEMKELFPEPRPPERQVFGPKGEKLYKPGSTTEFLTAPDEKDPKYQIALNRQKAMMGIWSIYLGLALESDWKWTAKEGDYPNKQEFCMALYKELKEAKMPYGIMGNLLEEIFELSAAPEEVIEEAKKDFLSAVGQGTLDEPMST